MVIAIRVAQGIPYLHAKAAPARGAAACESLANSISAHTIVLDT